MKPSSRTILWPLLTLLIIAITHTQVRAQSRYNWTDVVESTARQTGSDRRIIPSAYRTVRVDDQALLALLTAAPLGGVQDVRMSTATIVLPTPDGGTYEFRLSETPVMESELQSRFPMIRTYTGVGVTDPAATLKLDRTPHGIHGMVITGTREQYFIDPYAVGNRLDHIVYWKSNFNKPLPPGISFCSHDQVQDVEAATRQMQQWLRDSEANRAGDCQLRTYALALACTGEYANYHGSNTVNNDKSLAMAAMATTLNRVNGIYERDATLTMVLVANNDQLIYLDGGTDPYSNNNGSAMLSENVSTCNNVIGSSNYDIGHVFSTGGGGVAFLQSVCTGSKAGGVTGSPDPIGDPFDVDYVAHEMGHQFGGNHTQNNNCNRAAGASVEVGSGITIMGYAGICAPNVGSNSMDFFGGYSLSEVHAFVTSSGHTCETVTSLSNSAPTADAGDDFAIPKSTAFKLTGSGSDSDVGDQLTYSWEQMDAAPSPQPPLATNSAGPAFRPILPSASPERYFPNLPAVVAGTTPTWEVLSSVTRTYHFRLTVRDNAPGGGCNTQDNTIITVDGNSGPFAVTQPNTAVYWQSLSTQTITWNVANSSLWPVSCVNVKIMLSVDGGTTYPHILSASTPNDGSETVQMPNATSTTCRIMVQAIGNIFYDISNSNFTLGNCSDGPTADAGANQTIASGGSTVLAGSGGSIYLWSPTFSLSNPNIWNPVASPTATTTYTLTVTDANGCTDTDQVTITVTGTGGGGAPANDNPCSATALSVGSSCSYITGTNVNATGSSVPTPSTCAASSTSSNPSGNYQGGDVWYSAVVPASGQLIVQTQIQSSVTDLVMVAYTGASCSSLTQLACSDDQVPGSNYMPRLHLTGLTSGQTIRFRIYDFGNNNFGNFGICAYNPGGGGSSGRDLISWITAVSDNTVEQGDDITVTYKVKNIGTLNVSTPFLSALYLSTDPNYSSGSDELVDGSIEAFISLNAGQEYTATNIVTIPNEPDGNYYLISYADAATAVGETNESNNYGFWAIQLGNLVPDGPNLEVDDVDVIPNTGLAPGQEVDVEVRLENTGTEDSDNCDVLVVFDLNENHVYNAGVDPILESIIFPSLEPGEDDTRTRDIILPTNIPSTGGYDIIAVADINNECNETDESDQEGSEEVQISTLSPAGPDIVPAFLHIELPPPSNVQVSPASLCVTNGYDIFFTSANIGNLDAPGGGTVETRVYISEDPVISGNDYIWSFKFTSSGSFDQGDVFTYHDNDTFEGAAPGAWYLIISTDDDNEVVETNEANNIVAYPIYITDCGVPLPDLTGTLDFYTPFSSTLGDTVIAEVTVWNQGSAPAPPHRVGLYVSDDQQYDGSGGLGIADNRLENLGYFQVPDSMFPDDTLTFTIQGSSQGLTSTGLKYLIMAVDDDTEINELDRSNNNITAPIEITSVACYYNPELYQLTTPYVDYLGWTGYPLYMNTEDGCAWTLSENVSWATGFNAPDADDGPWFLGINENPYPVARAVQIQLNGAPLLSITQGPRPCALVGDSLQPHLTAALTHASCDLPNGAIEVIGTGHYLPLQYAWSTTETSAHVGALLPGNYSLTITDAAGCTLDTMFTITNTGSACTPVQLHANLEGPFNGSNMNDALRIAGFIPTIEPYTPMGLHVGAGGGETVGVDRLAVVGDSAVVDWVLVELRSSADPAIILETRSALLLRNGAIVSPVGSPALVFGYASGSFNLAVRHRNHLGVMTGSAVTFTGSLVTIDFRSTTTGTWGTEAQKTLGSVRAMWSGNTTGDDVLKYTGPNNDRDPILVRIGGTIPTNTVLGYFMEDCNLNGVVQYTGALNDRDPILVNIGGTIPTNTKLEQLP